MAFDNFDPEQIARYDAAKIARLLADPGIVRNRIKIQAAIRNAWGYLTLQERQAGFDAFLWLMWMANPGKTTGSPCPMYPLAARRRTR